MFSLTTPGPRSFSLSPQDKPPFSLVPSPLQLSPQTRRLPCVQWKPNKCMKGDDQCVEVCLD